MAQMLTTQTVQRMANPLAMSLIRHMMTCLPLAFLLAMAQMSMIITDRRQANSSAMSVHLVHLTIHPQIITQKRMVVMCLSSDILLAMPQMLMTTAPKSDHPPPMSVHLVNRLMFHPQIITQGRMVNLVMCPPSSILLATLQMFMTTAPKPDHPPDMSVHLVNRLMFHPQIITQGRMVNLVMCPPSSILLATLQMFMTTAPKPDHPPPMSVHLVNRLMFHPQIITQGRMVNLVMCLPSSILLAMPQMLMTTAPKPDHPPPMSVHLVNRLMFHPQIITQGRMVNLVMCPPSSILLATLQMFMTTAPKPDHPPDMSVHLVNRLMFHPQIITQGRMVNLVMCLPSSILLAMPQMFMTTAPKPDHPPPMSVHLVNRLMFHPQIITQGRMVNLVMCPPSSILLATLQMFMTTAPKPDHPPDMSVHLVNRLMFHPQIITQDRMVDLVMCHSVRYPSGYGP
jgi:hypothetical protein